MEISGNKSLEIENLLIHEGSYVEKNSELFQVTTKTAEEYLKEFKDAVESADDNLENAENKLSNTQDSVDDYTITAPISGTVITKNVKVGDKIPFMLLSASSLEDVERAAEVLGDVTGHHAEGVKAREQLRKDMESVVSGLSLKEYTCAILHGTPHSVTLEGKGTIATETAALLHIRNVFVLDNDRDMKLPPFSLETLVAKDPDIIFLTTMVMPGQQQEAFRKSLMEQPAWAGMRAVKAGRVYFLPQKLFLSSPGMEYPKALSYMADVVYGGQR